MTTLESHEVEPVPGTAVSADERVELEPLRREVEVLHADGHRPRRRLRWRSVVAVVATEDALHRLVSAYGETLNLERWVLLDRYRLVDMARKVIGVGSVGMRSWMLLLLEDGEHPSSCRPRRPARRLLEALVGASEYDNCGQRVVVGQRLMQAVSDILLGWVRVKGAHGMRDFYLRQLRDWKGSAEIETMLPEGMRAYAEVCGWTLARAHARFGDRVAIAAYLGGSTSFDTAVREFADSYADQNERDHQSLVDAIASGVIRAEAGV